MSSAPSPRKSSSSEETVSERERELELESEADAAPDGRARDEIFRRLSASARTAFALANALGEQTGGRSVHMEHLILGLAEKRNGPAEKLFTPLGLVGTGLRRVLLEAVDDPLPDPAEAAPEELTALPSLSGHVWQALRYADDIATKSSSKQIKSRHLLFGALSVSECHVIRVLLSHGAHAENVSLYDAPPEISEVPTPSANAAATAEIAGFGSDRATGSDLLDVGREVEALCSVIAARDVEPPLSIGLFGDWGTGKTFFMQEMRNWIDALAEERKKRPDEPSAYCKNIVQLWFNAWHYIDTNLWANLAEEIFDGLAQALKNDTGTLLEGVDDPAQARARLLAASSSARDVLSETERVKAAAEAQKVAVDQQIESLTQHRSEIERGLGTRELIKAAYRTVIKQSEAEKKLASAAKELGIPDLQAKTSELREKLVELRGFAGVARAIWMTIENRPGQTLVLCVVAAAIAVAGYEAPDFFPEISAARAQVVAAIVSALTFLTPIAAKVGSALKALNSALKDYQGELDGKQKQRKRELEAQREQVEERLLGAEEQRRTAQEQVQAADRELTRLRADHRMSEFIQERRESTDYRQHLGLVARARHDFQKLSQLLSDARQEAATETEPSPGKRALPQIDRIVLYIDDLDRCPEEKVVDVLQAVHLLLAFPLFVVVVGVDSRRLLQSLKHRLGASSTDKADFGHDGISDEERLHWQSTPLSYLEKIFQIPFTLRPMDQSGFGKLIDSLADTNARAPALQPEPRVESRGAGAPAQPQNAAPRASGSRSATAPASARPSAAPPPSPPGASSAEAKKALHLNPGFLQISAEERQFMKDLHPLIPSPRATKRFVNIYRLLRASVSNRVQFLEQHQYRPVLMLLAILTGHPLEATDILRDLAEGDHPDSWWDFLNKYAARATPLAPAPESARPPDVEAMAEAVRWRELLDKLLAFRKLLPEAQRCAEFAAWAPLVARYSFESGRVFLVRPQAPHATGP